MKLERIIRWLDNRLDLGAFDDVSNNGLQIARGSGEVDKVAFAVDGSLRSVRAAAAEGAQLLVVHHGISWGGGIRRLTGGEYEVVRAAIEADLALYAAHLPLDANRAFGNNWELARYFGLKGIEPAFSYHGNVIGVTGFNAHGRKIGICSGGAGEFAAEAKALGCDLYVTGEANWGEKIAAANISMPMVCAGHYETETFGVRALMKHMHRSLKIATTFVTLLVSTALFAGGEEAPSEDGGFYIGAAGRLVLPEGGARMRRLAGAGVRFGGYLTGSLALEGEAASLEDTAFLAARAVAHFSALSLYDRLFGYSRFDPFATLGAQGWIDGEVGPAAGLGAFYYLTDTLALRVDGDVTFGIDGDDERIYSIAGGLQITF